jgi:ribosomal protein S18 acetylase RimI-like enzyme
MANRLGGHGFSRATKRGEERNGNRGKVEPVEFRRARSEDEYAIAHLIYGDRSSDGVAVFGNAEQSIQFGTALMGCCIQLSWRHSEVVEHQDQVVGVIQDGFGHAHVRALCLVQRLLPQLAFRIVRAVPAALALNRVRISLPADAWTIRELHVRADVRGRGAGGSLLQRAEERARDAGAPRLALMTRTNNPARRLYERHGFRVTRECHDHRYERITGATGRVAMEKSL